MAQSRTQLPHISLMVSVVFSLLLMNLQVTASFGATILECSNGITARIYGADEITDNWLVINDQGTLLQHPVVGTLELLSGTDDERLGRKVSQFYTYDEKIVTTALTEINGFQTNLVIDIFILPSLPIEPMSSFARRGAVFLAPGIGPVAASTQAYTLTHEIGHILTGAFLDNCPERWEAYLQLRDISLETAGYTAPHADRAREIIAEDFRYLYGGTLATEVGSIENHYIALPDQISGLSELLVSFFEEPVVSVGMQLSSQAFPNPCNPLTTIGVIFPVGLRIPASNGAKLQIFDIRGRLIRTLVGGELTNNRISIKWDSTSDAGSKVASGTYLFVVSLGNITSQGRIIVIR